VGQTLQTTAAASISRSGWLILRFIVVGALAIVMAASLTLLGGQIGGYAIHLCGWPAQITCETGTWIWWLIPASAGVVAAAGGIHLMAWALHKGPIHLVGMAHVLWVASLFFVVMGTGPRRLEIGKIALYAAWGGIGIELLRASGLVLFSRRKRVVHTVTFVIWAAYIVILLALPSILEGVAINNV